jgi:serine/threonine transporter
MSNKSSNLARVINAFSFLRVFPLVYLIALGMCMGFGLGATYPNLPIIGLLGDLFVTILQVIAPFLVFFLVMNSVATTTKRRPIYIKNVIILYLVATTISAVVACVTGFFAKPAVDLGGLDYLTPENLATKDMQSISGVFYNLTTSVLTNPITAIQDGNFLAILFWSLIIGFGLKSAKQETRDVVDDFTKIVIKMVGGIIKLSPIGIMGLVYTGVTASGVEVIRQCGSLLLLIIGTFLLVGLVVFPIIVAIMIRKNPFPLLFYCITNSSISAFFMRSSAANIPVNLSVAKKMGLDESTYLITIPLGATLNMGGSAITIFIMTLAAINTLGIQMGAIHYIVLIIVSSLAAMGASGVAGGSLLLIPLACNVFGISNEVAIEFVSIGFMISIFQDSFETALNSFSDLLWTATSELHYRAKRKQKIDYKEILV